MKHILIFLSVVCSMAFAGPVENMAGQCSAVMEAGLCRVALDPKDYPNATIPIVLPTGVVRVSTAEYLAVRALGFQKDAQGRWLMCQRVLDSCTANFDGDGCRVARAMFRQTAP